MFRAILINDEVSSLDTLKFAIDKNENVEIAGKYPNASEALGSIKKIKPDLFFLISRYLRFMDFL